jgi:hypothetical protein
MNHFVIAREIKLIRVNRLINFKYNAQTLRELSIGSRSYCQGIEKAEMGWEH